MTDEHKLNRDAARQVQAEALIGSALLTEAFDRLEAHYVEQWRITQFRDTDARERLWQAVNVVRKVRDHLTKVVSDGKLAQRELNDLTERRRRLDIFRGD